MNSNINNKFLAILLSVCFLVISVTVYAQDSVYLSLSSVNKRFSIAVEPFTQVQEASTDLKFAVLLKGVIENDLVLSRYFNLVVGDAKEELQFDERMAFWKAKGSSVLLTASVITRSRTVALAIRMYDVSSKELIWHETYTRNDGDYRALAHEVSNEIVRRFTGEKGIALSKIAFINNGTNFKELYVIDYDGHNLRRLTRDSKLNVLPKWSPSGDEIIYTSYLYGNPDLFSMNLKKNQRSVISSFQGLNTAATFSPDEKRILLTLSRGKFPSLYLISKTGEIVQRMTQGSYIDTSPSFAPNGKEIVFISDRSGAPQMYIMNIDGGNVRRIITSGFCDSPAWSPRGDKIAFTMRSGKNYDLYIYDLASAKVSRLTNNQGDNENPVWSPDGRFIAFSSSRKFGRWEIYIMAIDGSGTRKLAEIPGNSYTPAWSVNIK